MTASLQNVQLRKGKDGAPFPASQLWQDGPVLVVVLRRPGCLLCREEAIRIWNSRDKFEAAGLKLVCIVHEYIEREITAFAPEYWGGDLFYDEEKAFNKAVHGGNIMKGSLLALLNPWGDAAKNVKRAKESGTVKDSNLKGDGLTLGGLMIVKKGGEVAYSYGEKTFGDHAPPEEVLAAAQQVGSS